MPYKIGSRDLLLCLSFPHTQIMDSKQLNIQQNSPKRSTQQKNKKLTKKKKGEDQSIKVVYISNPMRVTTTASEFKVRVQELTGRESDVSEFFNDFDVGVPPLLYNARKEKEKQHGASASTGSVEAAPAAASDNLGVGDGEGRANGEELCNDRSCSSTPFDMFDYDMFEPHLLENFPGIADSPVASPSLVDCFRRLGGA